MFLPRTLTCLQHADNAQQAFSSDQGPTLHLGLPALEALHKAWSSRATRPKYADFEHAIEKGLSKVSEYYDKTSSSDVYTLAMIECLFAHVHLLTRLILL